MSIKNFREFLIKNDGNSILEDNHSKHLDKYIDWLKQNKNKIFGCETIINRIEQIKITGFYTPNDKELLSQLQTNIQITK